jgi:hypothetical protein
MPVKEMDQMVTVVKESRIYFYFSTPTWILTKVTKQANMALKA